LQVVQNGGVDVILNNYSNRSTPSSITFTPQGIRFFGEDSKNQAIQHFKTTITSFKHLLDGKIKEEQDYISCKLSISHHHLSVKIGEHRYDAIQLYTMFLASLKNQIVNNGVNIGKCVISVPGTYTSHQRELVIYAAKIAGFLDVEVISETLAAGMTYLAKNHKGVEQKRLIVDVGYSQFTISLLNISEKKVIVEKSFIDHSIGGRVIDKILCDELLKKVGFEFDTHSKPYQRVLKECEKLKKILSANNLVNVNIESITEDKDINTTIKREEFERWIGDLLERLSFDVHKFLSKLKKDKYDSVELIGGSSRVPIIKNLISKKVGMETSTTLNQDEAISIGNAFLSTAFIKRLNDSYYQLKDLNLNSINLHIGDQYYEMFTKYEQTPIQKFIDLEVNDDFEIEAKSKHSYLGRWKISRFNPQAGSLVRIQVGVSLGGILNVVSVHQGGLNEQSNFTKMFSKRENEFEATNQLKVSRAQIVSKEQLNHYVTVEKKLQEIDNNDRINKETKNLLESKIYRTRRNLKEDQQDKLGPILDQLEDWLYEDGDEAPTDEYRAKIAYIEELLKQ